MNKNAIVFRSGPFPTVSALKSTSAISEETKYYSAKQTRLAVENKLSSKVVKKFDLMTIPLFIIIMGLTTLDKSTLGAMQLFNIKQDLSINDNQFSLIISIFYFGIIITF